MTKRMLVDATHPEETRVAIVDGTQLSDFDFERESKKQLKGNIYLAKVIRIEPSLQAAFVEYGGNRHGFLPFSEIHPDYFRIPVGDRPHDEDYDDADDIDAEAINLNDYAHMADDADMESHAASVPLSENLSTNTESTTQDTAQSLANTDGQQTHSLLATPIETTVPVLDSAPVTTIDPSSPSETLMDFSAPSTAEATQHGLITDFSNAPMALSTESLIDIAPLPPPETIGGDVEVERVRRQPRMRYKIQEVVKRRQVMLIQVVKEERGNKGAALTTFLSLAGRYCVLMPNTDHGGGVSRKITNHQDRKRMKEILDQLETPEGMAVILRTAGMEKEPPEIQRDLEYLLRLWNNIREQTLQSTAPALIYEEANLIKRSIRDLYSDDVNEILVAGTYGHQLASDFMKAILPDQMSSVKLYEDAVPLFFRYNVEKQIDQLYTPTVQLRSGGYIVINPTEALVSIDVNSGRATRERHIESTALKTNLEAADEIARQLRLRDLAGLVVIDFIDMEDGRNNAAVERRMKEAMKADRARLQIGRISAFGLLELSRQRLHPSLMEINFEKCPHCAGMGLVRSVDSAAISVLRMIEEEGIRQASSEIILHVPTKVALYILNQKRAALSDIERRYNLQVLLHSDDTLVAPDCRLERVRGGRDLGRARGPAVNTDQILANVDTAGVSVPSASPTSEDIHDKQDESSPREPQQRRDGRGRGDRRSRFSRGRDRDKSNADPSGGDINGNILPPAVDSDDNIGNTAGGNTEPDTNGNTALIQGDDAQRRGRRRGRRGGRGRRNGFGDQRDDVPTIDPSAPQPQASFAPAAYHDQPTRQTSPAAPKNTNRPIPTSIFELDTTPREEPKKEPYEVVSSSDEKPKGGWWARLTGQSNP